MDEVMQGALDLMLVGMGFVFSFLVILVCVTMLMSRIAGRIAPPEPPRPRGGAQGEAGAMQDPKLKAVISEAVARHRARRRQ
ncbi:sodium pump decarboxylase subunit gamma [Halovibrio salipaludis]|uniref:Probable oxaloacetate decarboxylase gamma chain n=1 Tax=Halovibrio salipaludis TaxID=2032626 RepID=A0A2A2F7N7_9GAMM|nr:OadG family protein [Halovibrio salipaludis]PAU80659.1 sodium pump decarboxylase subunit gamma [Halovibrio salipaludis]